jgi:hypothetical protein
MTHANLPVIGLSEDQKDALIFEISEKVEVKLGEREAKKFRTLYVLVALVSFIGIGAIAQFIDFYATKAVDKKLDATIAELFSEKLYAQLLIMSSELAKTDSFTDADRDAVMRLLEDARKYPKIPAEPTFAVLLGKIVDAFVAADNQIQVDKIVHDYRQICFTDENISATLLQHYGRLFVGLVDITTERARKIREHVEEAAASLDSAGAGGASAAFRSVVRFKELGGVGDGALRDALVSYSKLDSTNGLMFHKLVDQLADVNKLGKVSTPELERIAALTGKFKEKYGSELAKIPGGTS